jgi:hypothetical protein
MHILERFGRRHAVHWDHQIFSYDSSSQRGTRSPETTRQAERNRTEIGPRCKAEVREDVQSNVNLLKCIRHFLQREELQKHPRVWC